MDIARWAMPDGATPQSVVSLGGRYGYQTQDQGQTPNTQFTVIDFGGPKLFFEDRGLVDKKNTMKVTNEFYTDEGVIKGGKFYAKGKTEGEPLPGAAVDEARKRVTLSGRLVDPSKAEPTRNSCTSATSSIASAAASATACTPKSSKDTVRPSFATSATFPSGWARKFRSAAARNRSPTTRDAQASFDDMKEHLKDAAQMKLEGCNLPARPQAGFRRRDRPVHRRPRGERIAHAELPPAVRGAGKRVNRIFCNE